MKHVIWIILLSVTLTHAQKLKVDKIDDFTGKAVKETSRELLFQQGLMEGADFRIRKVDNFCFLDLRWARPGIFSITEGSEMIFLMPDRSTYTLKAMEYDIAKGGEYGMYTANITYANADDPELNLLEDVKVAKVRIYTSDGYIDYQVKEKHAANPAALVKLVNH